MMKKRSKKEFSRLKKKKIPVWLERISPGETERPSVSLTTASIWNRLKKRNGK